MARRLRPVAVLLSAVVGAAVLGGCGTGAMPYPPSGIDELVIPTPSPTPTDFVAHVDNPWLPLRPGRTWVYDVRRTGHPDAVRTVSVLTSQTLIAGVRTTAVRSVLAGPGEQRETQTDYYAQDTRGNVWWFGRAGVWRAGAEGAQAGLVVTATPRLGDGYRAGYETGRVEDVVTVNQVTPDVKLEWTSPLSPGSVVWQTLRRGIGVVERLDTSTGEHDTLRR